MKMLMQLFGFSAIVFYLLAPSALVFAASPAPTCTITVTPSSINVGGSITLRWSSTNATGGAITNVGNVGPSGSANLLPSSAAFTTYIGSFSGPGGTTNCSATVQVGSGGGTSGVGGTDTTGGVSGNAGGTAGNDTTYGTQNATIGNTSAGAPVSTSPVNTVSPNGTNSVLVPCGTGSFNPDNTTSSNSTACQACDLASLIQNIINFLIGISIPLAAALFAYAGVLYFTSTGDHHKLDQAKQIFKDAFIGFVIVITAWLVINTLLHVLFSQSKVYNGDWFTIKCSTQKDRPTTGNIGDVLGKFLGTAQVTNNVVSSSPSPIGGSAYVCQSGTIAGDGYCHDANGNLLGSPTLTTTANNSNLACPEGTAVAGGHCYTQEGIDMGAAVPTGPSQQGVGDCSAGALADDFAEDASTMSCIAQKESSCSPINQGDKTTAGQYVSIGTYQINMTNHAVQCDEYNNGQSVNCPAAFSGQYTGSNHNIAVVNSSLYSQCKTMLMNPSCNAQVAQGVLNTEGFNAWSTYKSCR